MWIVGCDGSWAIIRILKPAKLICDELLGVGCHGITWAACSLSHFVQKLEGIIVGDEKVQPPPAVRIGFQTVQEATAVVSQFAAKPIAASVCGSLFGSPCAGHRPPVCWTCLNGLRRLDMDGEEISKESFGQGGEIGHRDGI
jgi:hypothetical protein